VIDTAKYFCHMDKKDRKESPYINQETIL